MELKANNAIEKLNIDVCRLSRLLAVDIFAFATTDELDGNEKEVNVRINVWQTRCMDPTKGALIHCLTMMAKLSPVSQGFHIIKKTPKEWARCR